MITCVGDPAQRFDRRDVENVFSAGPTDVGRVIVGAASKHREIAVTQRG